MGFIQRSAQRFNQAMTRSAAVKVHQHLVTLDPDMLARSGVSLELLAKGPAYFPWKEDATETNADRSATAVQPSSVIHPYVEQSGNDDRDSNQQVAA